MNASHPARERADGRAPLAVVTGAGARLGEAVALSLLRDGWRVIGVSRQAPANSPLRAFSLFEGFDGLELADPEALARLFARLQAQEGALPEALAHCAATFGQERALDAAWDSIEAQRRVNCDSFVAAATAWARLAGPLDRGAFVALLDAKVARINPDHYGYTLSKLQLAASIPFLAQALAPSLRVNAVAPGLTLPSGHQSQAEFDAVRAKLPLGGGPDASDIAAACGYLLASPWVTGQTIVVDGGQHLASPPDIIFQA